MPLSSVTEPLSRSLCLSVSVGPQHRQKAQRGGRPDRRDGTKKKKKKEKGECRDDKKKSRGGEERWRSVESQRQIDKRENGMLFHYKGESYK